MFRAKCQFRAWSLFHEAPSAAHGHSASRQALRALGLALLLMLPGDAQISPSMRPFLQQVGPINSRSFDDVGEGSFAMQEKRLRNLNLERQKSMVADANKLLMLALELDDEVSRTNPDSFTPAELRKVEEIEKLAHRVRQKMSTSVRGMQDVPPFPFP